MKIKYIIVKKNGCEYPIIFDFLAHKEVRVFESEIISAGFCALDENNEYVCWGWVKMQYGKFWFWGYGEKAKYKYLSKKQIDVIIEFWMEHPDIEYELGVTTYKNIEEFLEHMKKDKGNI